MASKFTQPEPGSQHQVMSPHTAAMQALFPFIPEVLEFESCWNERGNDKRYMLILFFPLVNQFQILLDDSKVPLTIAVENPRTKETMRAWDLHVGAVLDILGRSTTLMTASMKTMGWLDEQAKRLWKQKKVLEKKCNKFRPKPNEDLGYGVFRKLDGAINQKVALGGVVPLDRIASLNIQLETELSQYQ